MAEIWKDVECFEGLYQVSNLGRVKSLKRVIEQKNINGTPYIRAIQEKILKPQIHKNGYVCVGFTVNGKVYGRLVHRLVAQAFVPNPSNKPEVNHKDGNKENNSMENLEWCTARENQMHSISLGLRKGSELHGGGSVHITKDVNDRINLIVSNTGIEKWSVVNSLLLNALEMYETRLENQAATTER